MTNRELRTALRNRETIYGTLVVSPSPSWPSVVAQLGVDYVFVDTEHIPLDRSTLAWMCAVYAAENVAPVVRIPSPDPYEASMVLDGGAAAVLVPYVETVTQVRDLVGAVKHKPLKGELLKHLLDHPEAYAAQAAHAAETNAGRSLLINIESVPAIERLDELLGIPGVDGVIVGPHDLSASLGVADQWRHGRFIEAVETILRTARKHNVSAGIHVTYDASLDQYERWRAAGANIVLHLADILAFDFLLRRDLADIRRAMGGREREIAP